LTTRIALRRALAAAAAGAALFAAAPAANAGENEQASFPAELFLGGYGNICNGDPFVAVEGTIHIVGHVVGDPVSNNYRQGIHFNTQGVTAIGASGTVYTVTNISNNIENLHPTGAREFTGEVSLRAVSRGSEENTQIHEIIHMTTNANGETTADVLQGSAECRG
jgi:hypothetical protein